jgi:hypothetical protein
MSLVGSIIGGITGANAASDASSTLQKGAQQAQSTIKTGETASQDFLNNTWSGTQQNFNPYLDVGSSAAHNLQGLLNTGFQAPSFSDVTSTPGYQFNLQQGTDAINKDAAARGTLLSGNTGVALQNYGQGLAQNTYQQNYSNALQGYNANLQGLLAGSTLGQSSASTLGSLGNQAAGLNTNINLGGAQMQADQINRAAEARASGFMGRNQAWQGMIGGITGGAGAGFGNMSGDSSGWENVGNFALGALAI